jgi:deazaflavin-dependent oxidoreductase (nitroreductase family)
MPFPRWLARVNLHFTNRLLGPLAGRLPGMGIVVHSGRKTHRSYRTPVLWFRHNHGLVIALTYGRDSHWVQNVLAAKGCQLETMGHTLELSGPRLVHDEQRKAMPMPVRFFLALLNVSDFMELTLVDSARAQ